MKQIFRKDFTKRDIIIDSGGIGGALVCLLLGWYIRASNELTELTTEAWQEFRHWVFISDCFMIAGSILVCVVCIYNLIQNIKREQIAK